MSLNPSCDKCGEVRLFGEVEADGICVYCKGQIMDKHVSRAKVYIPNEPMGRNDGGDWRRKVNLSPARDYGDLVFLTPAGQLPEDPAPTLASIAAGMANYTERDYVVFLGDSRAIAWTCAIAAQKADGLLRLLLWNRDQRRYDLSEVQIPIKRIVYTTVDLPFRQRV